MTRPFRRSRRGGRSGGRAAAFAPGVFALGVFLFAGCGESEPRLTFVSWGGAIGRAEEAEILGPYRAETGKQVRMEDYSGGLAQVRAQVDTGRIHWDTVNLEIFDAVRGCDEGLLEPIPPERLARGADGSAPEDDFAPETLTECGAGTVFYSTMYAYHPDAFPGEKPSTIEDFFDLERFPGRRGMRRSPLVNLEMALMADGVALDEVYRALDTPEGLDRAFRKLDSIRDEVVWWEAGAQPPQMLADREVGMSTAYNGRIFNAQVVEEQPFVIVWDGQVLDVGQVGIVAGTENLEQALEFVAYYTTPSVVSRLTRRISYPPARLSGFPLVSTHITGIDMHPHLPTSPENRTRALMSDWRWWSDNLDEMNDRFSAWLSR